MKKRTPFHQYLMTLTVNSGGIKGLCRDTGIAHMTMRERLAHPRGLRWYEYLAIVDALRLDAAQETKLQATIKGAAA